MTNKKLNYKFQITNNKDGEEFRATEFRILEFRICLRFGV